MANLDNFVRDNPVLHDVWVGVAEKGKAEGRAEGRAEGKAEGKSEGEIKGTRDTIRRVLEARFGPLSEEMLEALQAADLPRLEHIAEHAALDTLEQVRVRLGLPAS